MKKQNKEYLKVSHAEIIGELIAQQKYKFVNFNLIAEVVDDTLDYILKKQAEVK